MAQRRMFSLQVVNTDRFLEMPPSAQLLYFQLGMHADDDGFVSSPKRIATYLHCRTKDLQMLIDQGLVIPFDSGIVVITDWKLNNCIRADRYCGTIHLREKNMLALSDNKRYVLRDPNGCQTGANLETQDRIGKDRVDKNRIDQNSLAKLSIDQGNSRQRSHTPPPAKARKKAYGKNGWVQLSDGEYTRLADDLGTEELERCIGYVDDFAQATGNIHEWRDWKTVVQMCSWENWGKDSPEDVFQ